MRVFAYLMRLWERAMRIFVSMVSQPGYLALELLDVNITRVSGLSLKLYSVYRSISYRYGKRYKYNEDI